MSIRGKNISEDPYTRRIQLRLLGNASWRRSPHLPGELRTPPGAECTVRPFLIVVPVRVLNRRSLINEVQHDLTRLPSV
jgi:hypothetical protein